MHILSSFFYQTLTFYQLMLYDTAVEKCSESSHWNSFVSEKNRKQNFSKCIHFVYRPVKIIAMLVR